MILLIDNYDSFVFNLARYIRELGCPTRVVRNDEITVAEVREMAPQAVVLSPGPCTPNEAGICLDLIRECYRDLPMLGVCLGHQAIGAAFGAVVSRAPEPVHGRVSMVRHASTNLFAQMPNPFQATRYHSLIVEEATLPAELVVTAWTADNLVMGLEHREFPICGLQFHPESILTQGGHRLLANFLTRAGIEIGQLPPGDTLGLTRDSVGLPEPLENQLDLRWVSGEDAQPPLHW